MRSFTYVVEHRWAEMMNGEQKNADGDSGQKTILRISNQVIKSEGVLGKVTQSYC